MMTDLAPTLEALGHARVDGSRLADIVAKALDTEAVEVLDVAVEPVDYPMFSIATGGLMRVLGTARDTSGELRPFRIFIKLLQSAAHWQFLHVVPSEMKDVWVDQFPWRIEIEAFEKDMASVMPTGMRLPDLYAIDEVGSGRAAIWMEDVDADPSPWPLERYPRAAYQLGQLAGRRPIGTHARFGQFEDQHRPGMAIRMYVQTRIQLGMLPLIENDDVWRHPALVAALEQSGESTLRDELRAQVPLLDDRVEGMNALPQTYVHGDASPQNLLVPRGDPDTFVVIDWSFNSPHCVGFDLGQLLMGLANPGLVPASMLPEILDVILPAYVDGLATTGLSTTYDEVRQGFVTSLLVRDLYTTVPLDQLDQPDSTELRSLLRSRIAMARFLLGIAREL